MNFVETLVFYPTKRVPLVPSIRKDVERNLTTDGKRKSVVGEFFPENLDEFFAIPFFLNYEINVCGFPIAYIFVGTLSNFSNSIRSLILGRLS